MSILSQLFHKKITFKDAAAQAATWTQQITANDPIFAQMADETLSVFKQGASDAIMLGSTALGQIIAPAADAAEAALQTALAKATGGLSVPFNPIIDSSIDQMANAVKAAVDAWALEAKAKLAAGTPVQPPHA